MFSFSGHPSHDCPKAAKIFLIFHFSVNVMLELWPDDDSKRLNANYAINIPMAFPLWPYINSLLAFFPS